MAFENQDQKLIEKQVESNIRQIPLILKNYNGFKDTAERTIFRSFRKEYTP